MISLANRLLEDFNIEAIITEIEDISANFFVVLFERLFSLKLPGNIFMHILSVVYNYG